MAKNEKKNKRKKNGAQTTNPREVAPPSLPQDTKRTHITYIHTTQAQADAAPRFSPASSFHAKLRYNNRRCQETTLPSLAAKDGTLAVDAKTTTGPTTNINSIRKTLYNISSTWN